ncbi:MAG: winged helix-turn-helix transcriptional regulator [Aeromonadales bacterium]|nr:winged helix-turn-helix transcriptional regulator [Aeromonadales bacterium]
MDKNEVANIFKALGDKSRLEIISLLKEQEKCACKLLEQLNISQSTLSHHMKILADAKLIHVKKEGRWMHYSLNHELFDRLSDIAKSI